MDSTDRAAEIRSSSLPHAASSSGVISAPAPTRCDPRKRPLVVGQIALSFHVATAAVVRQALLRDGVAQTVKKAPHEQMYEWLRTGEVDLVVSAWLPGSHGEFIKPFEGDLLKLGVLYEPYTIWGVPDYVPAAEVASVADLLKPEVAARMTKVIQGIGPGAGISRFSSEIMTSYGLDAAGYEFRHGTLDDCTRAYEMAVAERRWVVVPLWHPQYLHFSHRIRALSEPRGLLRGKDEATLVLRKSAVSLLPERTLETLRNMRLGNATVAELDHLVSREGLSPSEAAQRWCERHPDVLDRSGRLASNQPHAAPLATR